jgi:hypothetical protein
MGKFVIETVQVVRRKYYANSPTVEIAVDAFNEGQLEEFSSTNLDEFVVATTKVKKWPKAALHDDINAAVMKYDTGLWETVARWDLR